MGRKESNQTKQISSNIRFFKWASWERSGSVVECLIQDWGAAGSGIIGATVLCPWARTLILA